MEPRWFAPWLPPPFPNSLLSSEDRTEQVTTAWPAEREFSCPSFSRLGADSDSLSHLQIRPPLPVDVAQRSRLCDGR